MAGGLPLEQKHAETACSSSTRERISLGSLYSWWPSGTMVYGILRLINFARGDLLMLAAYVNTAGEYSTYLGFLNLAGHPADCGHSIIVERSAYRPYEIRRGPPS